MDWFIDNGEQHGATNCSLSDVFEIFDSRRIPLSSQERAEREKIYPYYGAAGLLDYVDNFIFDGIFVLMGEDGSVVTEEGYPYLQYIWGQFWVNNHAHILQGKNGISILSFRSIQFERGDFPCPIANHKRPDHTSFPLPKFLRFHNDTIVKTLRLRPKKRDRLSRREFMRKHGNSYVLQKNSDIKNFIRVLLPVLTDNRQDASI